MYVTDKSECIKWGYFNVATNYLSETNKNKQNLKQKLFYAINSKAGFEFEWLFVHWFKYE